MTEQAEKARRFADLHRRGDPLILFNIWDAGSARAIAEAGAAAIATGSASVAAAQGHADGEKLPIDQALANAARIVTAVDLPVTVDFEGGYAVGVEELAVHAARLSATGAVGCNFEDQMVGGDGLHAAAFQAERLRAIRHAVGEDFFLNARTDIFLKAKGHDQSHVEEAVKRAHVYAEAGASGFFVPALTDLGLLERVCAASPLPVNYMAMPGGPSAAQVAACGVARISHGPFPYRQAMKALTDAAAAHYRG